MRRMNRAARAERILDAAERLFTRYGYDKTAVEEIAREAGVSKGAIYLHWPSKAALAEALLERETLRVSRDFLQRLEKDPEAGTIGSIYRHALAASFANPFVRSVLVSDSRILGEYVRGLGSEYYMARFRASVALLERLQDAGLVRRDLDPAAGTYLLTVLSLGLAGAGEVIPAEVQPPPEDIAATVADFVQRALAPEGGGDREVGKRLVKDYVTDVTRLYEQLRTARKGTSDGTGTRSD